MNSNFMIHESPGQAHHNHPHITQQNFSNIDPHPKPKQEKNRSMTQEMNNFINHHYISGNSSGGLLINLKTDNNHH